MVDFKECSGQDRNLLRLLQKDGRISNQGLADATAMSNSACWRRVKSLEANGVIEGYAALINPDACGLKFHAIVHVSLSRHAAKHAKSFVEAVLGCPEVLDCFATTGGTDYHLRVRCRDLDAYNSFLDDFLFKLNGILNVKTNLVLRQIKHENRIPL